MSSATVFGGEPKAPLLEMRCLTKRFGALLANDAIDFDLYGGEIHALLGENGAGKTTLMNLLYGMYHPDGGEIRLRGQPVRINSPRDAIRLRIGMIHQHFMLVPNLSVVENIVMGQKARREPFLDLTAAAARIEELARSFGFQVQPFALVRELPVGAQQRVEILKALYRGADLLILDEPTAVLSPLEVRDFFGMLRQLVQGGLAVIFITHKLEEVLEASDRITVLRRGRKTGTIRREDASRSLLTEMMIGREIPTAEHQPGQQAGPVLEIEGLSLEAGRGQTILRNICLAVNAGEIVGIAGVDGNGQQELAEAITGLLPARARRLRVCGKELAGLPASAFIRAGVGYVPADRQQRGLVLDFSVADNLILKNHAESPFCRRGLLRPAAIEGHASKAIQDYDIRADGADSPTRALSGGNQQKVILAREFENSPRLLVISQPTRGLDIGAMEFIHRRLVELRDRGTGVLLISTDLDEILALSDRVAVMFRGEIMGVIPRKSVSLQSLGRMMLGERQMGERMAGDPL